MRISDWSSDVCSSDLGARRARRQGAPGPGGDRKPHAARPDQLQTDFGGDQGILWFKPALAVHGPDQPAFRNHAQAPCFGAWTRWSDARARRLRGARRAPDPLWPRVPDRNADTKSAVRGKRVAGPVALGGCRIIKKKKNKKT